MSAESEAGVRVTSSFDPLTSGSARLVTVIGSASVPLFPSEASRLQEEEELLLDGHLVRLLVDEVDPLARAVEDDAEVGADRRDEPLRLAERLADAVGRARRPLAAVRVRGDRLDAERAEHDRQDERGRRVRVVDDDAEAARADRLDVERPQEVVGVGLRRARGRGDLRRPRRGPRDGTPGAGSASRSP